jgi:hypothetical protein
VRHSALTRGDTVGVTHTPPTPWAAPDVTRPESHDACSAAGHTALRVACSAEHVLVGYGDANSEQAAQCKVGFGHVLRHSLPACALCHSRMPWTCISCRVVYSASCAPHCPRLLSSYKPSAPSRHPQLHLTLRLPAHFARGAGGAVHTQASALHLQGSSTFTRNSALYGG